ncbi:hypothetical protein [Brevibacterium moorei]|uniref:hypothetical protein n=1 Tax=Brevibacterium moorei TaxID=2968457 RepID=UPI00211C4567|nr:hypothetical protein [Brevibacterium sp. 68QC2CO]MCQ9384400.1 hypothetical protein [Brevibacterium sp. 68QC2CO]
MTDVIAETLARHQFSELNRDWKSWTCNCKARVSTAYRARIAHQAEAVRAALMGDEAVERVERALDEHRVVSDEWDLETVAESVLAALIGGDRDAV